MAAWGQRPKDRDRDEAIKQIEAAAARGQIIEADKLKRIQEVRSAGSLGEIGMVTRGLALPIPAAPVTPTFEPYAPQTPPVTETGRATTPPHTIQYGEPLTPSAGTPYSTPSMVKKSGHGGKIVLLLVLILAAGIALPIFLGVKSAIDEAGDAFSEIGDLDQRQETPTPEVFTEKGLADLTAAVEQATGSTTVYRVVLYPEYAVVTAPADGNSNRSINYYWDGELSESAKGTERSAGRVDMADIDFAVLDKVLRQGRKLVEDPTSRYAVVSGPTSGEEGPTISAYATNDFSESGYISATLDGKIIRRVTPQ